MSYGSNAVEQNSNATVSTTSRFSAFHEVVLMLTPSRTSLRISVLSESESVDQASMIQSRSGGMASSRSFVVREYFFLGIQHPKSHSVISSSREFVVKEFVRFDSIWRSISIVAGSGSSASPDTRVRACCRFAGLLFRRNQCFRLVEYQIVAVVGRDQNDGVGPASVGLDPVGHGFECSIAAENSSDGIVEII